jgi:DNA repair exonuclease SbcCD nuclease subunit
MDTGQPVSGGEEIALTADELLESGAAGAALGHIHLRQQMRTFAAPVHYAGALFRNSFGEATGTKGGLIWDWNGEAWEVTPWDVPARRMVLIERTWMPPIENSEAYIETPFTTTDLEQPDPLAEDVQDAEVRVRITFPADSREAMRAAMAPALAALSAAAHSVVVEERPMIVTRARCSEITAARTTVDKLRAWSQAAESEMPAGAEAKLGILESEVAP